MRLLKVIASGGFGRVELVETNGQTLARKVYAPSPSLGKGADDSKLRKRFAREVRVQRALPDTMFMPILSADLDADPPSFLMPVADTDLEKHLNTIRGDANELKKVLEDILDALAYLHELDYIHRDLKPSNILLHNGKWKLSDFGLVLPPTSESTKLSSQSSAWGSLAYCAPEQAKEFALVTAAADIFSIGCILHDIFDGSTRVPFMRASCAGAMGAVIERCTEMEPGRRFKRLSALRAAIFDVLAAPVTDASSAPEALELATYFENTDAPSTTELQSALRYLRRIENIGDALPIFLQIGENTLVSMQTKDPESFAEMSSKYCEWVRASSFDFRYCDTIANRLDAMFRVGALPTKAEAVIAAAGLGVEHHRYYVMAMVLRLCGRSLDDLIAERIAVDIRASDAEQSFIGCLAPIGRSMEEYHPRIIKVLRPDPEEHGTTRYRSNLPTARF